MEDVEFRIVVHAPVALTLETARNISASARPRWRLTRISLRRLDGNAYECICGIDARDILRDNHADLTRFRDTFLSLLAMIAMVPVRPQIKGTFTFALGNGKFAQISLGPMNYTFPESPILSFSPLVEGLAFGEVYRAAVWFIWQAINNEGAVHRFLNLAIACELLIGSDSPAGGSRPPRCNSCKGEISRCPNCEKELAVPTTLRERAEFLFGDRKVLDTFIEFRNKIFHGRLSDCIGDNAEGLTRLNTELLVNVRNYLASKVGLKKITSAEIGLAVNVPDLFATAFYESK